jgi:hypothetical protein
VTIAWNRASLVALEQVQGGKFEFQRDKAA